MDILNSILIVNEFLLSCIFGCNLKESLAWFVIIYVLAITWEFVRVVCLHASVDEHNVESSLYFTELLTLTSAVCTPKIIRIVDSADFVDDTVQQLITMCREFPVLGMDCEMDYVQTRKKPLIRLLQFATRDGYCVLFRINFLNGNLPQSLCGLLSNDDIWKVGVGIYNDADYLLEDHKGQFEIKGTFDLRYLAHYFGIKKDGLKNLSQNLLGVHKNEHTSAGSWTELELTADRIMYAAVDAYLGILLFQKFYQMYNEKTYDRRLLTEENEPELLDIFFKKFAHRKSIPFRGYD